MPVEMAAEVALGDAAHDSAVFGRFNGGSSVPAKSDLSLVFG